MKTELLLFAALLILVPGCDDEDETIVQPDDKKGTIVLESEPSGARIFIQGNTSGKVTPDSIEGLYEGVYEITLKAEYFYDTSFTVSAVPEYSARKNIKLRDDLLLEIAVQKSNTQFSVYWQVSETVLMDTIKIIRPDFSIYPIHYFGNEYGPSNTPAFVSGSQTRGSYRFLFYGRRKVNNYPFEREFTVDGDY